RGALGNSDGVVDADASAVEPFRPGEHPGDALFDAALELTRERDRTCVDERVGWERAVGFEPRDRGEVLPGRLGADQSEHFDRAALFEQAGEQQELRRALKREAVRVGVTGGEGAAVEARDGGAERFQVDAGKLWNVGG